VKTIQDFEGVRVDIGTGQAMLGTGYYVRFRDSCGILGS
jgi:hypothetical protein